MAAQVRCVAPREPPATQIPTSHAHCTRRAAHLGLIGSLVAARLAPPPAHASGLLRFPVDSLNCRYVLIRAGQSQAEAQGFELTNPVAKTSMTNALSPEGRRQVFQETFPALEALGVESCWLWPAMQQNAYQTAEILASLLGVGRNRVVPEFSKLDARGLGALDGGRVEVVQEEVAAGDGASALWRPPRGEDGTPDESATDVLVRGRELLSLLETQFNGETVLLIAPDSDNLSILQAGVLGIDLRGHRRFAFVPGEARLLEVNAAVERDDSPRQIPCPKPPLCLS